MNATIDFQPTPEMQAVARSALARIGGGSHVIPKHILDRAKRIARGVSLSEDQVVEIHRESVRAVTGGMDVTPEWELSHQLRGGHQGTIWAGEKVAQLTARDDEDEMGPRAEVVRTGREASGLSLAEARARRRVELSVSDSGGGVAPEAARESVFRSAEAIRRAARAVESIRPDDASVAVSARVAEASQHCNAARSLLPSGHPCATDLDSACTVVDNLRSYSGAHGLDKTLDNLAHRVLTLDPDFDGDNDFSSDDDGDTSNPFDSENTEGLGRANFAETVICHSCGAHVHPRGPAETCPKCGASVGESTGGGGDFGDEGDPDLALHGWTDQARIASLLRREGERHTLPPVPSSNPNHPDFHWHETAAKFVNKAIWHANLAENPDAKEKAFHAGIAQKHMTSALKVIPSGHISERKIHNAKDWLPIETPSGSSDNTTTALREARQSLIGYSEDDSSDPDLELTWSDAAREAARVAREEHRHTDMDADHLHVTRHLDAAREAIGHAENESDNHIKLIHGEMAIAHLLKASVSLPDDHPGFRHLTEAQHEVKRGLYGNALKRMDTVQKSVSPAEPEPEPEVPSGGRAHSAYGGKYAQKADDHLSNAGMNIQAGSHESAMRELNDAHEYIEPGDSMGDKPGEGHVVSAKSALRKGDANAALHHIRKARAAIESGSTGGWPGQPGGYQG